jgi:hypothetical protein
MPYKGERPLFRRTDISLCHKILNYLRMSLLPVEKTETWSKRGGKTGK